MRKYLMMTLSVVVIGGMTFCSADEKEGKKIGETCVSHLECASNLCTTSDNPDGGWRDDGMLAKHCVEPTITQ